MVAVAFALPVESSDFRRLLTNRIADNCGDVRGEIHGRPVMVIHTGVGEKRCRARMGDLLRHSQFKYLISAGFAGALRPDLQIGDVLMAENFSSPELLNSANRKFPEGKWVVEKMATVPKIISSNAERHHWATLTGAVAVDMETEFIAAACATYGIPILSLRVISDTPTEPLPAPPEVLFDLEQQKTNFARLGRYVVTHPQSIKALVAFRHRVEMARRSLTTALEGLLGVDLM